MIEDRTSLRKWGTIHCQEYVVNVLPVLDDDLMFVAMTSTYLPVLDDDLMFVAMTSAYSLSFCFVLNVLQ